MHYYATWGEKSILTLGKIVNCCHASAQKRRTHFLLGVQYFAQVLISHTDFLSDRKSSDKLEVENVLNCRK